MKATSAAHLQAAAAAMLKEARGHASEITRKIARAGASGKYPNNIERDICRALKLPLESSLNNSYFVSCFFRFKGQRFRAD